MAPTTVYMRHPELDPENKLDPARAGRKAFDRLYAPKGWVEVTGEDLAELGIEPPPPSVEDILEMRGPQLSALFPEGADVPQGVEDRRTAVLGMLHPDYTPGS